MFFLHRFFFQYVSNNVISYSYPKQLRLWPFDRGVGHPSVAPVPQIRHLHILLAAPSDWGATSAGSMPAGTAADGLITLIEVSPTERQPSAVRPALRHRSTCTPGPPDGVTMNKSRPGGARTSAPVLWLPCKHCHSAGQALCAMNSTDEQ